MDATTMKHMALNYAKFDKFEGVDFRRWQKKMHFLLSSMSVVYVLTTPIIEDGDDANDSLEAKYMAEDASSKKFLVINFINSKMTDLRPIMEQHNELLGIFGKHKKEELTLVELGSHLRIKESLKVQDNDKPKGKNVVGPSVVNMVEYNNSSRYNDNKGKRKRHDTRADPNKKPKVTCWKCGKPGHLKKDYKAGNIGNKANGSGTKGSMDGSSNSLKEKMNRDVLTVGSTMRIPLLYRGEYSQWVERFMNYLEEQMVGKVMINLIKNGDQPLPRINQVSIARTSSTEQPPLKDKSMCNKTAKDLWDAFARHMLGFEYDPLALIAEKTEVGKRKEKVVVSSDFEGSDANDFSELKKITALLAKALIEERAMVHVCKDRCWFKTYESLNDGSILHIGYESTALVHGRGCVDLRLGHVHFKRMQDMSKDGLIPAFDIDTKKWSNKYFVTFIDDASKFCYVYLLYSKDEADARVVMTYYKKFYNSLDSAPNRCSAV
uniref:CCHC-type domain-containing protein n=1 Tax=Tanacetum cinerariifolium TaxID=118510 RepID=A0A699H5A2_TANCI|nr:hypothetical protein [Tanacetum cinerariifolium]